MPEVGLGIITYQRREALQSCLQRIQAYTRSPYRVVVADDGSEDGTADWLREQGIPVVTGQRRGVIWNRNRALAYLMDWTECDPIILLEDDGWPNEPGWEQPWAEAALRWGHIGFMLLLETAIRGVGTAEEPYLTGTVGGLCVATSRAALWAVGFLDTRFQGYGYGHAEWSYRFARLFSGRWYRPIQRPQDLVCLCLQSGIEPVQVGSWCEPRQMERNQRIFQQLHDEPIWRPPARDQAELEILGQELGEALGLPPEAVCERLSRFGALPCLPEPQPALPELRSSRRRRLIPSALLASLRARR